MLFPRSLLVAVLSAPLLAFAQDKPNPFNVPSSGLSASAGQNLQLTWTPTTDGTVSLILRSGSSNNLDAGTTIAKGIDNSGSYTWSVPESAVRGSDYAVEIVSDSDPSQTNYTPYFVLDSSNTGSPSLSSATLGAPSTSLKLSTASPTTETSSGSRTVTSSMMTTGSSSMSSSSASETGSTRMVTSSSASSGSGDAVSTGAPSSTMAAGAARATQAAGLLGAIALGALAL